MGKRGAGGLRGKLKTAVKKIGRALKKIGKGLRKPKVKTKPTNARTTTKGKAKRKK